MGKLIMKRFSKGFTLVEVLIAIAILGVIASVAVPQYATYVKKAKIAEAVQFSQEISLAMTQYYLNKRIFPANSGNLAVRNAEIGYGGPNDYQNDVIHSMWVGSRGVNGANDTSGHIAIRLNPDLAAGPNGTAFARLISTIEFKNGGFEFVCGNTQTAQWPSSVDPNLLPKSCQN